MAFENEFLYSTKYTMRIQKKIFASENFQNDS